jgi:hypothetical protein
MERSDTHKPNCTSHLNSCVALLMQNPLASAAFMAVIAGVKYRREIQLAQARLQKVTLARLAALPDYKRQFAVRECY